MDNLARDYRLYWTVCSQEWAGIGTESYTLSDTVVDALYGITHRFYTRLSTLFSSYKESSYSAFLGENRIACEKIKKDPHLPVLSGLYPCPSGMAYGYGKTLTGLFEIFKTLDPEKITDLLDRTASGIQHVDRIELSEIVKEIKALGSSDTVKEQLGGLFTKTGPVQRFGRDLYGSHSGLLAVMTQMEEANDLYKKAYTASTRLKAISTRLERMFKSGLKITPASKDTYALGGMILKEIGEKYILTNELLVKMISVEHNIVLGLTHMKSQLT